VIVIRTSSFALAAAIGACATPPAHPVAPARVPQRLETIVDDEAAAYQDAALFPDERSLLEDPQCRIDVRSASHALLTDDDARHGCAALASELGDSCRHACVVAARVAIAPLLQREMFAGVAAFREAFATREHEPCRQLSDRGGNQMSGGAARELWTCLGLGTLPARAEVTVQFRTHEIKHDGATTVVHDHHVTYIAATTSMLPGAPERTFAIGDDAGCTGSPCAYSELRVDSR
jgi:hypothetical protein